MSQKDRVYITWMAVQKSSASLKDIMHMFNCTRNDAVMLYNIAHDQWGKRPYKVRTKDIIPTSFIDPPKPKFVRPPAVYSNKNWNEI